MEFGRQNLGTLPCPQFITVFDTVRTDATLGEMLTYALNSSPSLVGQASLGIFGLCLSRSMLHKVNCHSYFSSLSILALLRSREMFR
jgi:hypothetical protein